jgi:hypothetical protein
VARNIEIGKAYVKRSGLTGKARKVIASRELGQRVECIADDNGTTIIIRKSRLYAESIASADDTIPVSAELSRLLDKYLGVK